MKIAVISFLLVLTFAVSAPDPAKAEETVVGEGKVAVLNSKRLLIEEKRSVVALDLDQKSGEFLVSRYQQGQHVKLMGKKTIDAQGNRSETIDAIVFEDGARFGITD